MASNPTLPHRFWATANDPNLADSTAIHAEGRAVSYAQFGALVRSRCEALRNKSLPPGARLVLLQDRSIALCTDIFAGLCSGYSVAILGKGESIALNQAKIELVGASLIIADTGNRGSALKLAELTHVDLDVRGTDQHINIKSCQQPDIPSPHAEALILFTSGSTGKPKGVAISQANIASNMAGVSRMVPITPDDHYLVAMPLNHTNGLLNQLLLPVAIGAQVTLVDRFEPQRFVAAMSAHQPTITTCVPTMLTRLLDVHIPSSAVAKLRFIRSGAAPLLPATHRKAEHHFGTRVIVSYGQSEATCTNTANPHEARKIGSAGKVLAGQELAIMTPDSDEKLTQGETGEVCFRGSNIAMGLLGSNPLDPTAWFRTGDCGYVDEDGYLFLTGRLKDLIIRGGTNLSPRAIEDVLLRNPAVAAAAVVALPDNDLGETPIACMEPGGHAAPVAVPALNQQITSLLSSSHRIKQLFEFDRLPLNDVGKIDTPALIHYATTLNDIRTHGWGNVRCEDTHPLQYIKRTQRYYTALGFGAPYEWAENADIPFTPLSKPLRDCTVALVTTAAVFQPDKGDQGPGAPYNADAKFFEVYRGETSDLPDLRVSHIAIDRDNTPASDIGAYFPLTALQQAVNDGRVGMMAKHFYGLPTNRSKRVTTTIDCRNLLALCQTDHVDAVILVPNCPVCHQSVTLAARALESAGIPTVVTGCARDIVQTVGAPRFLFNDFPLGNSAGRPHDPQSQRIVMRQALNLLSTASGPGAFQQSPLAWVGRENWKTYYSNPDLLTAEEIVVQKARFEAAKATAKSIQNTVKP